jgi:hypothetical protein
MSLDYLSIQKGAACFSRDAGDTELYRMWGLRGIPDGILLHNWHYLTEKLNRRGHGATVRDVECGWMSAIKVVPGL